jgi:hypothetical protein
MSRQHASHPLIASTANCLTQCLGYCRHPGENDSEDDRNMSPRKTMNYSRNLLNQRKRKRMQSRGFTPISDQMAEEVHNAAEIQKAEIQIADIQNADIQMLETQNPAEIQMLETQNPAEIQSANVQNAEIQIGETQNAAVMQRTCDFELDLQKDVS